MVYIVDTDNALYYMLRERTGADIGLREEADGAGYMLINAANCPDLTPQGRFGIILFSGNTDELSDIYAQRADRVFSDIDSLCCFLTGTGRSMWEKPFFAEQTEKAQVYLRLIGMRSELLGFSYLAFLTAYLALSPEASLKYDVLPAMEKCFGKSAQSMERAMRYAIETTWSTGDMDAQQELFGYSISPDRGKPVTRELAARLAEQLREQMNCRKGEI